MKFPLLCWIGFPLAGAPLAAQNATWTNYLRQTQMGTGVELQTEVLNNGTRAALLPLEMQGARFQIWTQKSVPGSAPLAPQLLDTKFVDAYQIASSIQITTGDPYTVIPRTRVDQPFRVRVQVSGLQNLPTAEEAARRVLFQHTSSTYPGETHVPPPVLAANPVYQGYLEQNGNHVFAFTAPNLVSTTPATSSGEENFTVSSLSGFGSGATTLATARLQVWPLARVQVTGIESGATYSAPPEVTFGYTDLYPSSTTWVQIYQGQPALGHQGTTVSGSIIPLDDVTPQDRTFVLRHWSDQLQGDGPWTLEVLHTTPFGTERLHYVSFTMNSTIEVRGQIFSSE